MPSRTTKMFWRFQVLTILFKEKYYYNYKRCDCPVVILAGTVHSLFRRIRYPPASLMVRYLTRKLASKDCN